MPRTCKGGFTKDGVEVGLARLCPLCESEEPLRWEHRRLINWNGKLRWAHPGCVEGLLVFKKRRNRKRIARGPNRGEET